MSLASVETDETTFLLDQHTYSYFDAAVWYDNQNIRLVMENTKVGTFNRGIYNITLDGNVTSLFEGLDAQHYSVLKLSPNGTQLAYFSFVGIPINRIADYPDALADLYIMNADGTQRREIGHHVSPSPLIVWSPNQQNIAWQTGMTFRIYIISTVGGSAELIAERCGEPVWRP